VGEALRDTRLDVRHRQLAHKVIEIRDTGARLFPGEVNIYFIVLQLLVWCIFSAKSESDSVRGEMYTFIEQNEENTNPPRKNFNCGSGAFELPYGLEKRKPIGIRGLHPKVATSPLRPISKIGRKCLVLPSRR
jgi:hypothetical protein